MKKFAPNKYAVSNYYLQSSFFFFFWGPTGINNCMGVNMAINILVKTIPKTKKLVKTLQLTSVMRNYHYKTKSSIIDIFTKTVVEIDVLTF
jgi:hypothetical protein